MYRFIQSEKASHSVRTLCRVMRVARAGYYAWRHRKPSQREQEDEQLLTRIEAIHKASNEKYGAPRIHAELRMEHGIHVSRKRVARLMRQEGLQGEHRRRKGRSKAQQASLEARVAPDHVQRGFDVEQVDRVWFADVKQEWTREGWLYLAAVLDAASKRIVGWSMSDTPSTDLVVNAVSMAAATRSPDGPVVHHTDRGSVYTSLRFGATLTRLNLVGSMGGGGSPHDNAVMESFFATLQTELLDHHQWRTRDELRTAIFYWIEVTYNRRRRHSTLGMLTPQEFETQYAYRQVPE